MTDDQWIDSVGRAWDAKHPLEAFAKAVADSQARASAAASRALASTPADTPPAPVQETSFAEAAAGPALASMAPVFPSDPLPYLVLGGAALIGVLAVVGARLFW
jgi:hypothetical protein